MKKRNATTWRPVLVALAAGAFSVFAGSIAYAEADSGNTETAALGSSTGTDSALEAVPAAEAAPEPKPRMDIYGFAMVDTGYDFKQVNPDWFDVLRPTKLPSVENEFGKDGNFYAGVRQSRLGFKGYLPTSLGEIKTIFEFELFGTGVDAGQTTFRLRHAWGELGHFGAGQSWSPFMDPDVFPNSLEYWGPNGMVFFRNVQLRWMPMQGENELFIALERPGASADGGVYADRIELQNIKPHFPAPDLSIHYKRSGDWGHVQLAGIVRYIAWTDTLQDQFDLSGHKTGYGVNLSTNLKVTKTGPIRASVVYGHGGENYMNDAPADIGLRCSLPLSPEGACPPNPGNPRKPVVGTALPVLGIVAFYDFNWSERFSSAFGYSRVDITNSDSQAPNAFKTGQYALANVLFYPAKNVMAGLEFQWGRRENFSDHFKVDDYRVQFSSRFNFDFHLEKK